MAARPRTCRRRSKKRSKNTSISRTPNRWPSFRSASRSRSMRPAATGGLPRKSLSHTGKIIGALIIEQIESEIPREILAPRLDLVYEHSARAIVERDGPQQPVLDAGLAGDRQVAVDRAGPHAAENGHDHGIVVLLLLALAGHSARISTCGPRARCSRSSSSEMFRPDAGRGR